MICAGTMTIRSRNVVKSIPISIALTVDCSAFCFVVPVGLIIRADQIFKFQVKTTQSPVAQLVEQSAVNRLVASSSLAGGAQLLSTDRSATLVNARDCNISLRAFFFLRLYM